MNLIEKECVIFNIKEKDKKSVIVKMVELLKKAKKIKDEDIFLEDVMKREDLSPTAMGYEIAIPHGKSSEVLTAGVCLGRLDTPIIWNEETGETAQIIILIAVPKEDDSNLHLKILSNLARKLMHEEFREILLNKDKMYIYEFMKKEMEV